MDRPKISVVIPTRDSAKTLGSCLDALKRQAFRDFETIVVDGQSTDDTVAISQDHGIEPILYGGGLTRARNIGFSKARGDIFVSLDSDMIPGPDVLGQIIERMPGHGALILPEVGHGRGFISRCKDLEKRCYLGDDVTESARAFTREAFEAVGGYDQTLHFGEDWDIHQRISDRFPIGRIDALIAHDTGWLTLKDDLRKAYRYGTTIHTYLEKGNAQSRRWLNASNFFFLKHRGKLMKEPLTSAGLLILKGLEYSAGLAGYASAIRRRGGQGGR